MNFLLMHQTITPADAIGNDIIETHRLLTEHHHRCYVLGTHRCEGVPEASIVDSNQASELLRDQNTVVIYHHSIFWHLGESLLNGARAKIIFRYHNVTPPNYFAMASDLWRRCAAGREQTYRFARAFPAAFWLSASHFNLAELGLDSVVRHRVVPPFITILHSGLAPDEQILRQLLADESFKLLLVSRVVPNKGYLFVIEVLRAYKERFGTGVTIFVAGTVDEACSGYFNYIMASVQAAELGASFHLVGRIPQQQLLAYFLGCDAYLCCSEHEGFCVPVVEAQATCLPVIARAKGALSETLGTNQILLGEDADSYAGEIHRLRTEPPYRDNLIAKGRENYISRFAPDIQEKLFLNSLTCALGSRI